MSSRAGTAPAPGGSGAGTAAASDGSRAGTAAASDGSRAGTAPAPGGRRGLHWESTGEGEPVLLIMGLGLSGGAWWRTVPVLAKRFRVITFDNRGVGQSHSLTYSLTTEAMADDAVSVLDAAGVDRARVYGISLGGMVAQQLALRHSERVAALVLGATHAGGRRVVAPSPEVLDFFRRRAGLPHEEAAWASVPYNYGPACRRRHANRIAEDVAKRLSHPFPAGAYRAQLHAARLHNCLGRLSRVQVPTMIVHGRHDRMIPVQNAYLMAERMRHARLDVLEHSGHLYPTEQPEVDVRIADFLAEIRP